MCSMLKCIFFGHFESFRLLVLLLWLLSGWPEGSCSAVVRGQSALYVHSEPAAPLLASARPHVPQREGKQWWVPRP